MFDDTWVVSGILRGLSGAAEHFISLHRFLHLNDHPFQVVLCAAGQCHPECRLHHPAVCLIQESLEESLCDGLLGL